MDVASEQLDKDHITVQCHVCGGPVNLGWTPSGVKMLDDLMMRIAGFTVHDHCARKFRAKLDQNEENLRIAQRSADFRLLCPPLYHDSDQWVKSQHAYRLKQKAIAKAMEWKFCSIGLTMHGKISGTGKTTTAWLILQREFLAGRFIVAMTHKEMSDRATSMAREFTPESKRWADTLRNCDLLFVDDLGKSRFKAMNGEGRASEEFLFDIMDERIKNKVPTIFTVNMTGDELKKAMSSDKGVYFVRRFKEFFISVNFDSDGVEKH